MESSWCAVLLILVQVLLWIGISKFPHIKHKKLVFIVLSFVSMWIFLAIREPYSDMLSYEKYFYSLKPDNFEVAMQRGWEIFFKLLLYCIKMITSNAHVMRCIIAFLTLIGPFCFIKRYSKNYLLSIVMFIALGTFYMQFFILRQAIAISIFLLAFHFITDKKLIKYCLSIIAAALFHDTAIVLLLIYPIVNIPDSKVKKRVMGAITILSLVFSPLIIRLLTSSVYKEYANGTFGDGMFLLAFYAVMYMIYAMMVRKVSCPKERKEIVATSLFTAFWQFFTIQNSVFCRMANYTRDSFCILIPNLAQELKGRRRVLFSALVVAACVCFVLATGAFSWYNILS